MSLNKMFVSDRINHDALLVKPWGLHLCCRNCLIENLFHSFFNGSIEDYLSANIFSSSPKEMPVIAHVSSKPEKSCMKSVILSASVGHYFFVLQEGQSEVASVPGNSAFDVLL